MSVSYTHLFRFLGIIYFVTSVLLSLFFFVRCRGVQTDLQMFCICPVSYTHLDVYKRQVFICICIIMRYLHRDDEFLKGANGNAMTYINDVHPNKYKSVEMCIRDRSIPVTNIPAFENNSSV